MFKFTRRIEKKYIIITLFLGLSLYITHYEINNKNYMTYIQRAFIVCLQHLDKILKGPCCDVMLYWLLFI